MSPTTINNRDETLYDVFYTMYWLSCFCQKWNELKWLMSNFWCCHHSPPTLLFILLIPWGAWLNNIGNMKDRRISTASQEGVTIIIPATDGLNTLPWYKWTIMTKVHSIAPSGNALRECTRILWVHLGNASAHCMGIEVHLYLWSALEALECTCTMWEELWNATTLTKVPSHKPSALARS